MTLPPMGLAQRLMLLGMLAVVLSTTVGGLLLREQLHAVILRSMAGSLGERADRIAAGMRLDRDGTPSLDHRLVNDEFRFVFSGWYWQLEEGGTVRVPASDDAAAAALLRRAVEAGVEVVSFAPETGSLEATYLAMEGERR